MTEKTEPRGKAVLAEVGIGILILTALLGLFSCRTGESEKNRRAFERDPIPEPRIAFEPRTYFCGRARGPVTIDGRPDEAAWAGAAWTGDFVDIEGESRPRPRCRTRARMIWDDDCLYVAAEMEEPHLWATLTERDSVIFQDNDFEIFIDPDGDSHGYYELEINALGTVWDLYLPRPYRDGGRAVDSWDIQGLRSAVCLEGTLNDPGDRDRGWSLEVALPWTVLEESAPGRQPPRPGDVWRINFSRVEWTTEIVEGRSIKAIDSGTGKPLPENNWVWSPQGLINMHYPEMWGYLVFSDQPAGEEENSFRPGPDDRAGWILRRVYYREHDFYRKSGRFTPRLRDLGLTRIPLPPGYTRPPKIEITRNGFQARLVSSDGIRIWNIDHFGRLWPGDRLEAGEEGR